MDDKRLIRVADMVQDALLQLCKNRYLECMRQLSLFASRFSDLTCDSRKMAVATTRGWFAAAEQCCTVMGRELGEMSFSISKLQGLLDKRYKAVPSFSSIVEELKATQAEFDDVEFNFEENALCVVTEPITLEEVYLGRFRIALYLTKLAELYHRSAYYIIAIDPHPATKDEAITHPHVSNETLCEGDGAAAIRAALEEGRLSDFFVMVRGILTTYNPDSPYVSLSDWQGVACYDCGYVMDEENSYYCSHCDTPVCDECSRVCTDCGEIVCHDCAGMCEICERSLCPNCGKTKCSDCESVCCQSCLTDGLCPDCKEEREREDEEQEIEATDEVPQADGTQTSPVGGRMAPGGVGADSDHAAIQPDGLGEAPVHAGSIPQ